MTSFVFLYLFRLHGPVRRSVKKIKAASSKLFGHFSENTKHHIYMGFLNMGKCFKSVWNYTKHST